MASGVGAVPDLINAGIYTLRGNYKEAAISGFFAVPIVGDLASGGRKVAKAADKVGAIAGQTTKHADDILNAGKQTAKTFPKASSKRLGDNLEKAGISKEGIKNPQAHHDLPITFQDKFNQVGLDIDAAEYGRWVEGAETGAKNVGTHQNWSSALNKEWEKFFSDPRNHNKEKILNFMEDMRKKYPPQ
jgi:hypothetical protein